MELFVLVLILQILSTSSSPPVESSGPETDFKKQDSSIVLFGLQEFISDAGDHKDLTIYYQQLRDYLSIVQFSKNRLTNECNLLKTMFDNIISYIDGKKTISWEERRLNLSSGLHRYQTN